MKLTCTIHPDSPAYHEALGHLLCSDCFELYRIERRQQQSFSDRKFLQQILRVGYGLESATEK